MLSIVCLTRNQTDGYIPIDHKQRCLAYEYNTKGNLLRRLYTLIWSCRVRTICTSHPPDIIMPCRCDASFIRTTVYYYLLRRALPATAIALRYWLCQSHDNTCMWLTSGQNPLSIVYSNTTEYITTRQQRFILHREHHVGLEFLVMLKRLLSNACTTHYGQQQKLVCTQYSI